jgi:hypothetical protein
MEKYKPCRVEVELVRELHGNRRYVIDKFIKAYQRPGLFDKRTYEDELDELVSAHLEYKKYKVW